MFKRKIRNWRIPRNGEITEFDKKILAFQNKGELVPTRELVKTPEQIEGIRRSGVVNTGVLDLIQKEIHVGMSTLEIDQMVYDYTVAAEFAGKQTRLTLTAPDTVAGLTAVLTEDSGALEFDGLWVETGPLDPEGLTPAAALPAPPVISRFFPAAASLLPGIR